MSAGGFTDTGYESEGSFVFPIRIQPETLTLTLGGVANAAPTTAPGAGLPSAQIGKGRRTLGVNARLIRFVITAATLPPGYKPDGVLTLPVLQSSVWAGYARGQTGTYTLNGTAYEVRYVGKTPEKIN